jgi:hypothetical protein
MNRYERAAMLAMKQCEGEGWRDASPFWNVPEWLRQSNACRAAYEIGAYLARCNEPMQSLDYIGGRKAPAFALADGRRLAVWNEWPGIRIKPA